MATFGVEAGDTWAVIADGADTKSVGILLSSGDGAVIAVATSAPASNSNDYIPLSPGERQDIQLDLAATEKCYLKKGTIGGGFIRGHKTVR